MDAHQAIQELSTGNERFLSGKSTHFSELSLAKLKDFSAGGHAPKAIILCCSDARAPVEIIFDQDIGDLFVIRVAGNIIAPSLVGSVEYAAGTYGTNLVLVMGHTQCGAVKATLDHIEHSEALPSENIHEIVSRIKPHIFTIAQRKEISYDERFEKSIEANVHASVSQLSHSSRVIENLVREGSVTIRGAVLDLVTGKVRFL